MPSRRLLAYIRKRIASGETDDIIARALAAHGWSEEEIQQALDAIKQRPAEADAGSDFYASTNRKKRSVAIALGMFSVAAGILLKSFHMLQLVWGALILCMLGFLTLLWFAARRSPRHAVALFISAFVVMGLSFLLGISGPQHTHRAAAPATPSASPTTPKPM